jgi:agmatine/peptidylarginine deiminase|tara:strand:- start:614 stop:946 length:333 start_codon:yes stop_codon:yes gene_type:complete
MSDFFDSEIIQEELEIINDLQEKIYEKAFSFDTMTNDERLVHIDNLSQLLEKQQIMYTRLSLSDDPKAIQMKGELEKSVTLLGFPAGTDVSQLFRGMSNTIESLRQKVDP